MTSAICMAKARRSGKPAPQAATRSPAGTPMATPATKTATVAASAKTNASGSQRSAKRVRRSAMRCSGPSPVTLALLSRRVTQREDRQLRRAEKAQRQDAGADAAADVDAAELRLVPALAEAAEGARDH